MDMTPLAFIGYATGIVGAILTLMSKVKNDNLVDLKERVAILEKELVYSKAALEKERKEAQNQHVKNREAIAELRTQVKLYKDLQLDSIAKTNSEMLAVLKNSALIAADAKSNGGILVHTEQDNPLDVKVAE